MTRDRVQLSIARPSHYRRNAIGGDSQVPTFAEAGVPGVEINMWYGVLAPMRTPVAIADKMGAEIEQFVRGPEFGERVASLGIAPFSVPRAKLDALMRADLRRDTEVIKAAA